MNPSLYNQATIDLLVERINKLSPSSAPVWGKMNAAQMLAHCALTFEFNNGDKQNKAPFILRVFFKGMMRKALLGSQPYPKNTPTAANFKVADQREFDAEKARLITLLERWQADGPSATEKLSHSILGSLTPEEWSFMMYKHTDHHLVQFGV